MSDSSISHRSLAAQFFDETWTYLERTHLTPDESDRMIHCAHASMHHWLHAPECTSTNRAIGYWQLARVYEKAGIETECARYARSCLQIARELGDTALLLNGHEVAARAAALRGERELRDRHERLAREQLSAIADDDGRAIYLADIDGIPD